MIHFLKSILRFIHLRIKFPKSNISFNSKVSLDTQLNQGTHIMHGTRLGESEVGRYTYIAANCEIERTTIGSFCSIGTQVLCGLASHPINFVSTYPGFYTQSSSGAKWFGESHPFIDKKSVTIGSDVWIGARSIILGGVKIGDGAIVGAGSIVTKDVPAYAITVGTPAKVIRYRFDDEIVTGLKASRWWNLPEVNLADVAKYNNSPTEFLNWVTRSIEPENA